MSSNLSESEIMRIARVMHEAVRAFQASLGQPAVAHWNKAPKWMHTASRDAVMFRVNNPDAPASAQHDQWMDSKVKAGTRVGSLERWWLALGPGGFGSAHLNLPRSSFSASFALPGYR